MKRSLLFALLLAACSDPVAHDPCAREFACLTQGADLEVVSVDVFTSKTDAVTTLRIVQPDSIPIRYVVRNRGTVAIDTGRVSVTLEGNNNHVPFEGRPRPALEPGEEFRDSFVVSVPEMSFRGQNDSMTVTIGAYADSDASTQNSRRDSRPFHLAVPILEVSFTHAGTIVAGKTIQVHVVARNRGTHADAPAEPAVTVCLYHGFEGCTPEYRTTASGLALPAVPAGQTREFDVQVTIPPSAAWQDASTHYSMYLCRGKPFSYETETDPLECLGFPRTLEVKPDYEAVCRPPLLGAGETVLLSVYNCGVRPALEGYVEETRRYRFHVVSFEAQAGVTYVVQRSDTTATLWTYDAYGNWVRDLDPAPERIRMDASRRIYISAYTPTAALSIRVTPEVNQ